MPDCDVAIVGLGRMGTALTERLLGQGLRVAVWNRSSGSGQRLVGLGARPVDRPEDVWSAAATAVTFLADDDALAAVCLGEGGLVPSAPAGAHLVDMSTVSVACSAQIASAAETHGLAYLRAPVSGNPAVLAAGDAMIVVSGPVSAIEARRALLERFGRAILHVGPEEQARVVKLALNMMLAGTTQLLAEAVVLGESHGIDRDELLEAITGSAVGSRFAAYKRDALVRRDYSPTFSAELLRKDLRLAASAAENGGVRLPALDLVLRRAESVCDRGLGDADLLALLPALQADNGLSPDVGRTQEPGSTSMAGSHPGPDAPIVDSTTRDGTKRPA